MKTAVLTKPGNYQIIEQSPPELVTDYKKLDVLACGICGSDTAIYYKDPPIPLFWPGHEIAAACKGNTYAVNPVVTCGQCHFCVSGNENLCVNTKMISHHLPGGFAEHIYVPESNAIQIDAFYEEVALVEPIASSIHAINCSNPQKGDYVKVVGGGVIGLLALQILKSRGIENVNLVAKYKYQAEYAEKFGSTKLTENPNVIILAVGGDGTAFQHAINEVRPHGRVIMMGNIYSSIALNMKWLVEHEVSVVGSQRYLISEFQQAVEMIRAEKLNLEALITHRFLLKDISDAFNVALNKEKNKAIKVLVLPTV